jgi:hypothetical protein
VRKSDDVEGPRRRQTARGRGGGGGGRALSRRVDEPNRVTQVYKMPEGRNISAMFDNEFVQEPFVGKNDVHIGIVPHEVEGSLEDVEMDASPLESVKI